MYGIMNWSKAHIIIVHVLVIPLVSCADFNNDECNLTLIPLQNGHMIQNPHGIVSYFCDQDYILNGPNKKACINGTWTPLEQTVCKQHLFKKSCPFPPKVPRTRLHLTHLGDGVQVEYSCERDSYLLGGGVARLICRNGQWEGPIPSCVHKATCKAPGYIKNGEWSLITKEKKEITKFEDANGYDEFEVGAEIRYSCVHGYKLDGPEILQCTTDLIWSRSPPKCIPNDAPVFYCPGLDQIKNGYCKCLGQETANLELCMPFTGNTRIECTCLNGYALGDKHFLTCTRSSSLNSGVWDFEMPTCYKVYEDDDLDISGGSIGRNGKGYNSGDISDDKNKVSSLVIVITTACSVLGVLGLIMVIVIFRKKKPRAHHIFQQSPAAPPYARVHNNSMDEHDRLALMAYAEASRVHLPSYEEAIRGELGSASIPGVGGNRSISPTTLEYQRLPTLQIRGVIHPQLPGYAGDGNNNINNNNNNNNTNRHSTVTTSTMNRDGVSEISGSIDTVNVSMSDETSVTVETFDSGTSNRSMSSQRATAGSLNSFEDHVVTDDAPLLETNSQWEADVVSMSSNPSHTSKED